MNHDIRYRMGAGFSRERITNSTLNPPLADPTFNFQLMTERGPDPESQPPCRLRIEDHFVEVTEMVAIASVPHQDRSALAVGVLRFAMKPPTRAPIQDLSKAVLDRSALRLHRSDVINRRGPFGLLCQPEVRAKFDAGLLDLIHRARFRMVCVVIDKQKHLERYSSPFHPYHYCLAAMLDRYTGWLNHGNALGDVLAESRGTEEDLQLMQAYRRVYESGTLMFDHRHHQRALTTKDIKVQPKRSNIAGLQLADILAHPVKQACLVERGCIAEAPDRFGRQVFRAAEGKFYSHASLGRVEGYGKVWL